MWKSQLAEQLRLLLEAKGYSVKVVEFRKVCALDKTADFVIRNTITGRHSPRIQFKGGCAMMDLSNALLGVKKRGRIGELCT